MDLHLRALERVEHPPRVSSSRPACSDSAPQQPWSGTSTSQPSARSTRTVAALTSPKNTRCTHPVISATVLRRAPAAGLCRAGGRRHASRTVVGGISASIAPSRGKRRSRPLDRISAAPPVRRYATAPSAAIRSRRGCGKSANTRRRNIRSPRGSA
ncbi:MAG: hypothetical protein JF587_03340 [Catenulisporales bacterium]|nr:hypothetical protein [Catenulisporales bacterium]